MSSTVDLRFRLTESDYVRALRVHYLSRLRVKRDVVVIVLLWAAAALLWNVPGSRGLAIGSCVLGSLFAAVLGAIFTIVPRVIYRSQPMLRDEYSISFSDTNIHFRTSDVDSRIQWTMYRRALITPHSVLLYYGDRDTSILPGHAFQDADQRRAFENLLTQHIPTIIRPRP